MLASGFKGVASYYMKKASARTEPFEAFWKNRIHTKELVIFKILDAFNMYDWDSTVSQVIIVLNEKLYAFFSEHVEQMVGMDWNDGGKWSEFALRPT